VQIQILLLLRELQRDLGLAVIFVTHDVGVAVQVADRVAVMYGGHLVEVGASGAVIGTPAHPYTRGLLASRITPDSPKGVRLATIPGSPPDLAAPPPGCPFEPRCTLAGPDCREGLPARTEVGPGHAARCVRLGETRPGL
jgi:peptide/nickel transport system ATP-binding protein